MLGMVISIEFEILMKCYSSLRAWKYIVGIMLEVFLLKVFDVSVNGSSVLDILRAWNDPEMED